MTHFALIDDLFPPNANNFFSIWLKVVELSVTPNTFMGVTSFKAKISQKNTRLYYHKTDIIPNTMIHMGWSPLFLLWSTQ